MRFAWRYLVMAAFIFWLGGFTFYASIVVPAGTEILGVTQQGFITQQVTSSLNVAGAVALGLLLVDLFVTPGAVRWRVGFWVVMAACQVALFWLHARLSSHMVVDTFSVRARPEFKPLHRLYLWLHTAQWLASLIYLGVLMMVWGRGPSGSSPAASAGSG